MPKEFVAKKPEDLVVQIEVKVFKCQRCGYEWRPINIDLPPTKCPKCYNPYWRRRVGEKKEHRADYVVKRILPHWHCRLCGRNWPVRDANNPPKKCPTCSNPNWKRED